MKRKCVDFSPFSLQEKRLILSGFLPCFSGVKTHGIYYGFGSNLSGDFRAHFCPVFTADFAVIFYRFSKGNFTVFFSGNSSVFSRLKIG